MLSIKSIQLDIRKMTEQQWRELLDARAEFMREIAPDNPVPSHEDQRKFLSATPELQDHVLFWLLHDSNMNCVGFYSIHHPKPENPDYEANKDSIYVEPVVRPPYRRRGVGTQLLPLIVDYARSVGASWVQWDTQFESGFRFSEKLGAIEAGRQQTNRLTVADVDWEMMRRWVDEGRSRNPDVELKRFTNVPSADLIEPYCDLVTDINRLQPSDNVEAWNYTLTPEEFAQEVKRLEERRIRHEVLYTRETDAALSGMTDMSFNEENPQHAHISLTGVRREYQGRGLGKWLKAAMMLDMRERYPAVDVVDTENFNSNDPMLSINNRMGFTLFSQFVFYKIHVDDLAAQAAKQ